MTAILKVDTIQDTSGNNIINENANTITIGASGDTTNIIGTLQNNGSALATTNGITMADNWRVQSSFTANQGQSFITANWERNDNTGTGFIGTAMSESSGVFTFPSTGIYLIETGLYVVRHSSNSNYIGVIINTTTDNSSYSEMASTYNHVENISSQHSCVFTNYIFDVTNTSTHKFKLEFECDNEVTVVGDNNKDRLFVRFIRLGDT